MSNAGRSAPPAVEPGCLLHVLCRRFAGFEGTLGASSLPRGPEQPGWLLRNAAPTGDCLAADDPSLLVGRELPAAMTPGVDRASRGDDARPRRAVRRGCSDIEASFRFLKRRCVGVFGRPGGCSPAGGGPGREVRQAQGLADRDLGKWGSDQERKPGQFEVDEDTH